jgi:RNA polymerase sigma-70 factor (ECF subfamily)
LCNYASKVTGNNSVSEDIVQNLFLQLYEKENLHTIKDPQRYLLKSIKFKCIDYLKTNKTNAELDYSILKDETDYKDSDIAEEDIEPLLHYFAAKLPPKTREVFLMSRNLKLTYKEIAEELGISLKTVEGQMGRALRMMRNLLKAENFLSLIFYL